MTTHDAPSSSPWSELKEGLRTMMTPEAWQVSHSEIDRARLQVEQAHAAEYEQRAVKAWNEENEKRRDAEEERDSLRVQLATAQQEIASLTQELRATGCQRDALRAELTYRKREHELARQRFKARSRPAYEGMAGMHTKEAADPSPADAWRLREAERGCASLRARAEVAKAALLASRARSVECDFGYNNVAEQLRAEIDTLRGARAELKAEVLASTARQEQLEKNLTEVVRQVLLDWQACDDLADDSKRRGYAALRREMHRAALQSSRSPQTPEPK